LRMACSERKVSRSACSRPSASFPGSIVANQLKDIRGSNLMKWYEVPLTQMRPEEKHGETGRNTYASQCCHIAILCKDLESLHLTVKYCSGNANEDDNIWIHVFLRANCAWLPAIGLSFLSGGAGIQECPSICEQWASPKRLGTHHSVFAGQRGLHGSPCRLSCRTCTTYLTLAMPHQESKNPKTALCNKSKPRGFKFAWVLLNSLMSEITILRLWHCSIPALHAQLSMLSW
jgi:hypothetical protein